MITDEDDNTTEKQVTLKMEGEEILSTYFAETISTGEIQLTVGSASTDTETIQEYLKSAAGVAMLLNSGKMPIQYTINSEEFINPIINSETLSIGIYILIGIAIISIIYLIIKYKKLGALTAIGTITAIDLLVLAIRYTNVYLSIESAISFIILIIFNLYIVCNVLKLINKESNKDDIKKAIRKGTLKSLDVIIVMLIIAIVFTFISWSAVSNIGILMFWGIICILFAHLICTRTLLLISEEK
jgi:preprotein translocase subunit SecD